MPITIASILSGAVQELQDDTNVRWTVPELCGYYNDGLRATAMARPDSTVKSAAHPLIAGTRQTLPADGTRLVDMTHNSAGSKRAIRQITREILDAQVPGWHGLAGKTEIKHFVYDVREPLVFYTYPPAVVPASVQIIYSARPTEIVIPAAGVDVADVVGNFSLPDQFANPQRDYILFRAYLKDADYAANVQRADLHLKLFAEQLGIDMSAARAVAPGGQGSAGNPNLVTPRTAAATS